MKPCPTPLTSQLTEEDFNFTEVPRDEVESCLFYEYMRESESIIKEVKRVRRQLRLPLSVGSTFRITKMTNYPGGLFDGHVFLNLARSGKFPEVPWQKLGGKEKQWLLDFVGKARRNDRQYWINAFPPLKMIVSDKNNSLGATTLDDWIAGEKKSMQIPVSVATKALASAPPDLFQSGIPLTHLFSYGFFCVNLNYSRPALRNAFDNWLAKNHPQPDKTIRGRAGRNSPYDKLNALGAMRLRYHCKSLREAQDRIKNLANKGKGMSYKDYSAWDHACKAAERHFIGLLQLPRDSKPIHFKPGW